MSLRAEIPPPPLPAPPAPGRPIEIEEWSNRRIIHPLSRALAGLLIPTRVTPNQVSAGGVVMAACAGAAFLFLPWPANAFVGFAFHLAWHVFDGADGDLARRTGRVSTNGELIDGICDHLGQACLYLAFALMLVPSLGAPLACSLAIAAGLSRAAQASAYESSRRNYRRWVYGVGWIRQTLDKAGAGPRPPGGLSVILGRGYLALAQSVSADDRPLEAAMTRLTDAGPAEVAAARTSYREIMLPVVKRASILSANYRTVAAFLSVLAGSPLYYLLYELVVLNLVLAGLALSEKRANRRLLQALSAA